MSERLSIRFAKPADAEAIHAAMVGIAGGLGERERVTARPDDLRLHLAGEHPPFEALIAEVAGETAGVCTFFTSFSTYRGKPGVYVQDLHVGEKFRRMRIGAKLLERLAHVARQRGGSYIRLSVDAANESARRFYDSVGFTAAPKEVIHATYDAAFDALADAGNEEQG